MRIKPLGYGLIAVLCAVPWIWFVPLLAKDPSAVFSQYLGVTALILMAVSQMIATRITGIEAIFGPLDRAYILHKWLGMTALICLLLHDTIDADIRGIAPETWLTDLAETMGEISLYGLIALIILSIATIIPYHLWKWTHRFMGAVFALGAFHFAFIGKPFGLGEPLGLYVIAICLFGVLAYCFTLARSILGGFGQGFTVQSVEPSGDALAVTLAAKGRPWHHQPGQFAFVTFRHDALSETHPFTISSGDGDRLRVTIKPLGDGTKKLKQWLKPGMDARIEGPFGGFTRGLGDDPEIWIAAGIGITPFAAWISASTPASTSVLSEGGPPVHLFYCVRDRSHAVHLNELERAAKERPNFTLHLIETSQSGRLTAAQIAETTGFELKRCLVSFCGPEAMRDDLQDGLSGLGLPQDRFHVEFFKIRAGLGFRDLLAWLLTKTGAKSAVG